MEEEELLLGQQTEKKTMDHVIKYQDLLEKARNDHDTSIIPNDNILNTYCVLIEMLKHCNEIRIYCGEARLFTKKGIERLGQVGDKDVVKYLYSELINALNDFLSNPNKSLSIISERQPGDLLGKIKRIVLNKKNFSLSLLKDVVIVDPFLDVSRVKYTETQPPDLTDQASTIISSIHTKCNRLTIICNFFHQELRTLIY